MYSVSHFSDGRSSKALPRSAVVEVTRNGKRGALAIIRGEFRVNWLGHLTAELSKRLVNIETLHAEKDAIGHWKVTLELRASEGSPDPLTLRYEELLGAEPEPSATRSPLVISRATTRREEDETLVLSLVGRDEVGFLGSVLGRLGLLGAFPERIVASCEGTELHDTIWLRSFGGAPLTPTTERAILDFFGKPSTRAPANS